MVTNSKTGSRSRSRSRSRERLGDTRSQQHRLIYQAVVLVSIVCSKLITVSRILYQKCGTCFMNNKRAFLLILPLVTIGIYIHFACNMGHTVTTTGTSIFPLFALFSSVRSSNSHPDLLVTHPTFSDHTGPQHWTFTF